MSFMDKFTDVVDGQVEFNIDDGNDQNLVNYCNKLCQKTCETQFTIDDPWDCDCEISRLYWAMVKLAEWEHRGMTFEEYCKLPEMKAENQRLRNLLENALLYIPADYTHSAELIKQIKDALKGE